MLIFADWPFCKCVRMKNCWRNISNYLRMRSSQLSDLEKMFGKTDWTLSENWYKYSEKSDILGSEITLDLNWSSRKHMWLLFHRRKYGETSFSVQVRTMLSNCTLGCSQLQMDLIDFPIGWPGFHFLDLYRNEVFGIKVWVIHNPATVTFFPRPFFLIESSV